MLKRLCTSRHNVNKCIIPSNWLQQSNKMNWGTSRAWIVIITWILELVSSEPISYDAVENSSPSFVSIFSPRMDFDQWKPLTGRGDPLRNDPTYDYEPPVLERVHYWADETRLEREHYPEKKSEVLMLGVSSRKPSIVPRPPVPPRKHRLPPHKYEDFTYKLNDNYPMTILVPPPPPPPGHKLSLYVTDDKLPVPTPSTKITDSIPDTRDSTTTPKLVTYAVQESNLIYQSSTINQNWLYDFNETKALPDKAISSDYAGWGPTTPFEKGSIGNTSHNLIISDHKEDYNKEPYLFYKPMLSESPPPKMLPASLLVPTFVPTIPPSTATSTERMTLPFDETTSHNTAETTNYYDDTTTESIDSYTFLPTPAPNVQLKPNTVDMLSAMMSMPMIPDSERPEDNLYAHASETIQIFKDHPTTEDVMKLEVLQTMLPPPYNSSETITTTHNQPLRMDQRVVNNFVHDKPPTFTHDPYLHMRFTTPIPTTTSVQKMKTTSEAPPIPMYLIIQGHSKVKTYSSKPKASSSLNNEIPRLNETNEVKHLHPIKQKQNKNIEKTTEHRAGRAKNLKSLVDNGLGSIEIQETDIGIKYDVSDGSDVPLEIYRKGIVDSEENNYSSIYKASKENRTKRQIDLEDLLPFDEDTLEEYVYNFFSRKRNETGITGLIAQAITNDSASALDNFEDNDNSENEDR